MRFNLTCSGPGYRSDEVFDLSRMEPYNLMKLLLPFQYFSHDVVLYLPRTSDLRQLTRATDEDQKTTIVHYCMEGASKVCSEVHRKHTDLLKSCQAICAYFGAFRLLETQG